MGKKATKRVLVTGGAGFIGSHVAGAYRDRGWEVTVLDNLSTGKRENVPDGVHFLEMDVRDPGLSKLFQESSGFQLVNHHAAQMDVRLSVDRPGFDADVNILGLVNLLESARQSGCKRFLFVSSGGVVYGDVDERPISERAPKRPASPYGVSKLAGEYYLRCYRELHGLEYAALRYSNVYGPRQDPHGEAGVVAIFSCRIQANEPIKIFGDGEQTRDYVYVADVVEANMILAEAEIPVKGDRDIDDRAFNVGTGVETSVNELSRVLMRSAATQVEVERAPARPGELQWNSLRCERLRGLGWAPRVSLEEGLGRTYRSIAGTT